VLICINQAIRTKHKTKLDLSHKASGTEMIIDGNDAEIQDLPEDFSVSNPKYSHLTNKTNKLITPPDMPLEEPKEL
jgi:hypothetical protein